MIADRPLWGNDNVGWAIRVYAMMFSVGITALVLVPMAFSRKRTAPQLWTGVLWPAVAALTPYTYIAGWLVLFPVYFVVGIVLVLWRR